MDFAPSDGRCDLAAQQRDVGCRTDAGAQATSDDAAVGLDFQIFPRRHIHTARCHRRINDARFGGVGDLLVLRHAGNGGAAGKCAAHHGIHKARIGVRRHRHLSIDIDHRRHAGAADAGTCARLRQVHHQRACHRRGTGGAGTRVDAAVHRVLGVDGQAGAACLPTHHRRIGVAGKHIDHAGTGTADQTCRNAHHGRGGGLAGLRIHTDVAPGGNVCILQFRDRRGLQYRA
ncbi:hypothetical protein D3C81_754640 [compost metagenome]